VKDTNKKRKRRSRKRRRKELTNTLARSVGCKKIREREREEKKNYERKK